MGISFKELRLSDLVDYERVKKLLLKAETSFEKNDYQEAVNQAAAGLTLTLRHVQEPIVGKLDQSNMAFVIEDNFQRMGVDKDAYLSFRRVQEALLIVVLGMDYSNYVRYKSLAPVVVFRGDGASHFMGLTLLKNLLMKKQNS